MHKFVHMSVVEKAFRHTAKKRPTFLRQSMHCKECGCPCTCNCSIFFSVPRPTRDVITIPNAQPETWYVSNLRRIVADYINPETKEILFGLT